MDYLRTRPVQGGALPTTGAYRGPGDYRRSIGLSNGQPIRDHRSEYYVGVFPSVGGKHVSSVGESGDRRSAKEEIRSLPGDEG